jgi:hypothetical protein
MFVLNEENVQTFKEMQHSKHSLFKVKQRRLM